MSLFSVRKILLCLFVIFGASCLFAQEKETLKKERDKISADINLTNKLLKETRQNRNKMEGELGLLNKKIRLREDLISSITKEVRLYNHQIERNREQVDQLESQLAELKNRYAALVVLAHRTNSAQDRLMFIFASEDFLQAIRRARFFKRLASVRKEQGEKISSTVQELEILNKELNDAIASKRSSLKNEQEAKDDLSKDLDVQKETVSSLKSEERSLLAKLKKQEKQREKVNKEIQRIIEAEIRASKNNNEGVFSLTPEAAALSADFEKNRGKLPWPVERGVITQKFGDNPHPVLAGITVPNNGIDIATNQNAQIRAVFDGTISGVFSIPGAGKNVIINHGGYRTVYSNLKEVFVSKGQTIFAKDAIGLVLTDEVDGKTEAHIEIWRVSEKGTIKEDPARWIARQ
ncbi:MAG: peptidoglycan DD-metalloendopeptidase family protein [Flavobacteriales bacterium]|nr:peptidoglycan DD-metalloendopeptidase family protein [Flavobacteriales bacterium]